MRFTAHSDVQMCLSMDSVVDSHAHGLSFPPTLVVVGALCEHSLKESDWQNQLNRIFGNDIVGVPKTNAFVHKVGQHNIMIFPTSIPTPTLCTLYF